MWHDEEYEEPAVPVRPGEIEWLVAAYQQAAGMAERLCAAFELAGIVAHVVPTLTAQGGPLVRFDMAPEAARRLTGLLARGSPSPGTAGVA